MNTSLNNSQLQFYRENDFIVINDFLDNNELQLWRESVFSAVEKRHGIKIPGSMIKTGEDDGINEDTEYFEKVFD